MNRRPLVFQIRAYTQMLITASEFHMIAFVFKDRLSVHGQKLRKNHKGVYSDLRFRLFFGWPPEMRNRV